MADYTVTISEYTSVVTNLPVNTKDTPYNIKITGITSNDLNTSNNTSLNRKLQYYPGNRYIDLSETELPSGITDINYVFRNCSMLVKGPIIPDTVTDMTEAFEGCKNLTVAPVIPNSVTNMTEAFRYCESLITAPAIPSSVTNMKSTFYQCKALTTPPTIPSGVIYMTSTFQYCSALTSAPVIPDTVTSLSNTFAQCTSLTTPPTIPSGVTTINSIFDGCSSLTHAPVIPDTVTKIEWAFANCTSLITPPTIPSGVTSLDHTFYNCSALTSVSNIPSGVTNLGTTFYGCTSLTNLSGLTIPNSVTSMSGTFKGCTGLINLSSLVIPNSVTNMTSTFDSCSSLTHAPAIPSSVTGIQSTFSGCSELINVPPITADNATQIRNLFYNCSKLTSISLSVNSATNFSGVFNGCSSLSTLTLSANSATSLSGLFEGKSLTEVTLSDSIITDLSNVLKNCTKLTTATINASSATNLTGLFEGCGRLTTVTLTTPNATTLTNTFSYCTSLTSIPTLPSTVTNLVGTFKYCTDLVTVSLTANNATNLTGTFENCVDLRSITLNTSSAINMTNTFKNCYELTSAPSLASSVTNLTGTFENCSNLGSVPEIPESAVDMTRTFKGCSSITTAPASIPNTVTTLTSTFEDCVYLTTGILTIPESVTNMDRTYYNCPLLNSVGRVPVTVTSAIDTFFVPESESGSSEPSIVTPPSLSDYLSALVQLKTNLVNNLVEKGVIANHSEKLNTLIPKVLVIGEEQLIPSAIADPYTKMSDYVDIPEPDYTVTLSGLDALLDSLPHNTVNTPYKIKITNLTFEDITKGTLQDILADHYSGDSDNDTKFVDLLSTELPDDIRNLDFSQLSNVIIPPIVPNLITDFSFNGCKNIKKIYIDIYDPQFINLEDALTGCNNIEVIYLPTNESVTSFLFNYNMLNNSICHNDNIDFNSITQFVYGTMPDFTIDISELDALLQSLPENTVDNPYKIRVIGLTYNNLNSYDSNGLGYILKQNSTKYVDLGYTHIIHIKNDYDEYIFLGGAILGDIFYECTSLVVAPPTPTTGTCDTYIGCTNLKSIRMKTIYRDSEWNGLLPGDNPDAEIAISFVGAGDGYDFAFQDNPILESMYVDDAATKTALLNDISPYVNNSYGYGDLNINITDQNVIVFDPVTVLGGGWEKSISIDYIKTMKLPAPDYTCSLSELTTVLSELASNTAETAYKIKVTELTSADLGSSSTSGTLGNKIKTCGKYIDLLPTILPEGISSLSYAFDDCETLVRPPIIPSTVENFSAAFQDTPITELYIDKEDFSSVILTNFISSESTGFKTLTSIYVPSEYARFKLSKYLDDYVTTNGSEYGIGGNYTNIKNLIKVYTGEDNTHVIIKEGPKYLIFPYHILSHGGWVSTTGYYEKQTNSGNLTVFFEVETDHTYICMLGDVAGTRFRWMFTNTDISDNTQSIQGTSVYSNSTIKAFMTFQYTPEEDGYLVGTIDNADNTGVMAYLLDWTLMHDNGFNIEITDAND